MARLGKEVLDKKIWWIECVVHSSTVCGHGAVRRQARRIQMVAFLTFLRLDSMAAFENARQLMAYFRSSRQEWKVPEFVVRVALQLPEDNSYAPWMRTMTNKSFENHAHNLLTDFRVLLVH